LLQLLSSYVKEVQGAEFGEFESVTSVSKFRAEMGISRPGDP